MKLISVSGMASLRINGTTINTYDNTCGTFSTGTFQIGHSDPFNSVNAGNYGIFDNVNLEAIPEPSTPTLIASATCLLFLRRSRVGK